MIIATGVWDFILVELGKYFSSCFRVKTSEFDDAVRFFAKMIHDNKGFEKWRKKEEEEDLNGRFITLEFQ